MSAEENWFYCIQGERSEANLPRGAVYSSSRDCTHDEAGFRRRLLPAYPTAEVTGIAR